MRVARAIFLPCLLSLTVAIAARAQKIDGAVVVGAFVTPGLRAKLLPGASISPFVSVGGGWARYSLGPASNNKGALEFGGGVDFKTGIPLLGFRAEVRDFVTSEPRFDLGFSSVTGFPVAGSQDLQGGFHRNNVLVGGGAVFSF